MKNYFSKFIFISVTLVFVGIQAKSQGHIDFISKEVCTCITDLYQINPQGIAKEDLGKCFESVVVDNLEALETLYGEGIIGDDYEAGQKLGEEIGKKLAKECDVFVDLFVKPAKEQNAKEIEFYNQGENHLNKGEFKMAVSSFNEAIATNPKNATYYNLRGVAYFKMEDYYRAISDFYRAIDINPEFHLPIHNLAYSKYLLGDLKLALTDVDSAIRVNPNYADSYNLKGLILNDLGNPEEARISFIQANQLDEKNPDYTFNVAHTFYDERNYEKALEWFLKTSNLMENTVPVLSKIGTCYDILGNHPKAVEYHNQCIEISPNDYGVYFNRGLAYLSLDSFEEAKNDFQKAMDLNGEDVDVIYQLGNANFELGNLEKAKELVQKSLEIDPRNAAYYDLRASIYEAQGHFDLAIEDYTVSISLYPDDCEIHMALGQLFKKIQNPLRAKEYFQNALDKGCDLAMDYLSDYKK
jgi:tetratricopeptide (TPR) repeat protein